MTRHQDFQYWRRSSSINYDAASAAVPPFFASMAASTEMLKSLRHRVFCDQQRQVTSLEHCDPQATCKGICLKRLDTFTVVLVHTEMLHDILRSLERTRFPLWPLGPSSVFFACGS
jgi:hypothetical protein